MKKILLFCGAITFALSTSAQSNQLSFGADVGLPLGTFGDQVSLLVGPTVGFELPVGDNLGITAQAGYLFASVNSDFSDFIDNFTFIPVQVGAKYYLQDIQEGLYVHGQIGIHSGSVSTPEIDLGPFGSVGGETVTNTDLSFAGGAGFMLEKFDFGLRYNIITSGEDGVDASSYIGVRIAYILGLGG